MYILHLPCFVLIKDVVMILMQIMTMGNKVHMEKLVMEDVMKRVTVKGNVHN